MNASRRRQLRKVSDLISEAFSQLSEIIEEERNALDCTPDSLQQTERFERDDENCTNLEDQLSNLEELSNLLEEIIEA